MSSEVSAEQLKNIIRATRVHLRALPGYEGTTNGLFGRRLMSLDCDEVYPNIFVGDCNSAVNKVFLDHVGVTHILNAAEGPFEGMVNTNAAFYSDTRIEYMGIPLVDEPGCNISQYFQMTAAIIDRAIRENGKVLIHCIKGYSRSPAIAVSYLAIKVNMKVPMALKLCCSARKICPNDGFLRQLAILGNVLHS